MRNQPNQSWTVDQLRDIINQNYRGTIAYKRVFYDTVTSNTVLSCLQNTPIFVVSQFMFAHVI